MSIQTSWHREYSIETAASSETIWSLFRDVSGWVEAIGMDVPAALAAHAERLS